jgi:hypothetical protein
MDSFTGRMAAIIVSIVIPFHFVTISPRSGLGTLSTYESRRGLDLKLAPGVCIG